MHGRMMDRPLLISQLIEFAATYHGQVEIVSRSVDGSIHRYTYAEAHARARQLANALTRRGVKPGDRIATLAWNNDRHVELYFGLSGMGAVCHTLNPRLFVDQLEYIVNHARDRMLFADTTFVPILQQLRPKLKTLEAVVLLTDRAHMAGSGLDDALCYDELLEAEKPDYDWPEFDERTAASMCYTSGTTGLPRGALYSHRSTLLHTFSICAAEGLALSSREVVLPVVPMFHSNAWGIPYGCAMVGAKLVNPGPGLDGPSLFELMEREQVTCAAGVPTVWLALLGEMRKQGRKPGALRKLAVGGAAFPRATIEAFEAEFDVEVFHAWGMTEISPVGTNGRLPIHMEGWPPERRWDVKAKQGRAAFGVDLKIVDAEGRRLPNDGKAFGELLVRGPWVVSGYYENDEASAAAIDDEGWFRTGDVATLDEHGYMQIVDRSKDVIKSGGEWISSIELENTAIGHPDVEQAAVIGIPHPKWDERPLLIVVLREGAPQNPASILEFLKDKVARWWLPDEVRFVDEIPLTSTGKISKLELRRRFSGDGAAAD